MIEATDVKIDPKRPDSYIIIARDFSNKYFGKNESTNDSVVLRTSELQKI